MKIEIMKHSLTILLLLCSMAVITSCGKDDYPKYSLLTIDYIPDSLKSEHKRFIIETVRAASNQMTAGDYEDIDETIKQAERTANNIFCSKVLGLRKYYGSDPWEYLDLKPNEFNSYEKAVFNSLNK